MVDFKPGDVVGIVAIITVVGEKSVNLRLPGSRGWLGGGERKPEFICDARAVTQLPPSAALTVAEAQIEALRERIAARIEQETPKPIWARFKRWVSGARGGASNG